MAKNEAKIRFQAETAEFSQSLSQAESDLKTLRAEAKLNEAQFENTGDSAEYIQNKLEILEGQLEANKQKQEALTAELEVAKAIYGEDSTEVENLERRLIYAQTEEENLKKQVSDTNESLNTQSEKAEEAGSSVDTMAEVLINAGVADIIKDIASAAVEMAEEFDEASATIVEGTGASGDALNDLNEAAKGAFGTIADSDASLSSISAITAELNTRFGLTGESAEDMTTKISNFAQHTGTDGVSAVDSIANITKRWGLEVDDVDGLLDELTLANQSCQLSVGDLTRYLTDNSTQFQELGYSTDEALAMLISLSDGGANVGTVMSGMKKAVGNLAEVTDDVPGAFQDAITAIEGCDSVAEALNAQVGDTGKTVEEVFGAKAAQELATNVLNGSFAIEDWTKALQDSDGALESTTENATTMKDAWSQAANNVSMALSSTFAPAITTVVNKLAEIITKVSQIVQKCPALQAVLTAVAVALGILAAALAITSLISAVQKAFALLNTTLLLNPIFLIVTLIAALVAGLVYAYNHCETFRNAVDTAFSAIKEVITNVINFVKPLIIGAWENIKESVSVIVDAIGTVIKFVFEAIKTYITIYVLVWKTVITVAWTVIKTVIETAVNAIKTVITTVFNAIKIAIELYITVWKTIITTAWNVIKTVVTTAVNAVKTVITTVFTAVKTTISNHVEAWKTIISTTWDTIKSTVSSVVNTIKTTVSNVFSAIKETAQNIWNGIKLCVTNPIEGAKAIVSSTVNGIRTIISTVFGGIKSTVTTVWNGIKTAITTPIEGAKDKIKSIVDTIKGFFTGAKFEWPSIKTPHFSISPEGWKVGDLLKGTIPKLSISWYANGAVFDRPTLIPTLYGLKGIGEAGPETVAPIKTLQGYIEDAVERATGGNINYELLGEKVADAIAKRPNNIYIDKRNLARSIREVMG